MRGMSAAPDDPFAPGGRLRLARRRDDDFGPFWLRGANRDLGRLELDPHVTAARLEVGERVWSIGTWGRKGWRLAATDERGEGAAWWEDRWWPRAGRLVLAPDAELRVRRRLLRSSVGVEDDEGAEMLRVQMLGRRGRIQALVDVCGAPPADADPELLVGFVAAVLVLHRSFSAPQDPETPWIPGGRFGGGDGGGGGGGGDGGGS